MLPPEANSLRMYSGPGATPMMEAATAWTTLAMELSEAAAQIGLTLTELAEAWMGPSSIAMSQAAATYLQWLTLTASSAAHTAAQASAAVAAYETAFAATVPPFLVASNRFAFEALVATNFLGINTPAILETEAEYVEMWAQDVAAMVAYQAGAASATQLAPFMPPNSVTTGVQPQPVTQGQGSVQNILSGLQGFDPTTGWAGLVNDYAEAFLSSGAPLDILGLFSNMWSTSASTAAADAAADAAAGAANSIATAKPPVVNVAGAMATAPRVGGLSVPQSWGTSATQPVRLGTTPIIPGSEGEPGFPGMPGMVPPLGKGGKQERVRYGTAIKNIIPRHPSAG